MQIGLRHDDAMACKLESPHLHFPPRRRLYGIGMGKTGTHALASLFSGVRSAHEAEAESVIKAVLDYEAGRSDWRTLRNFVVDRDERLGLAVDVSNLNIYLLDLLVSLDANAMFVLTIRDPWSWLDSILNHYLVRPATAQWRAFADHRFSIKGAHPPEERSLAELGLHPIAGYLGYWRAHMTKAMETVPADRLLVIPVTRIAAEAERIAAFGGFATTDVDRTRMHRYANETKRPIVQRIPQYHLEAEVRGHCGPLVKRFFPGIQTAEDAGLAYNSPPGQAP
jgi:hypothetical protein